MLRAVSFTVGYSVGARMRNRKRLCMGAMLALGLGGCSISTHIASLQLEPEMTASIGRPASPLGAGLDEEDWRRAQSALSLAIDPQGSGQPVNWDNPSSRRRGSFVPNGNVTIAADTICRPFIATMVDVAGKETRQDGQACRSGPGEWAIREMQTAGTLAHAEALDQPLPPVSAPLSLSADRKL